MIKAKFATLSLSMLILISCVTTKTYTDEEKRMRMGDGKSLVVMKDGTQIAGDRLTFHSGKKGGNFAKIDNQEINVQDISAYQTKKAYYVRFGSDDNFVWVKQLKRGKINLYYYDETFHTSSIYGSGPAVSNRTDTHFIFQKGSGQLVELSIERIADMLKDNRKAYAYFSQQFGSKDKKVFPKQLQNHPKVLFQAIDLYNGNK